MPEMTRYEHGVPSWVDMGTTDLPAGVEFYSGLFGWEAQDMGEEAGHYTMMSKNGKQVAGISPAQDPGPPRWTTYINVDDAEATAKAAGAAGGQVVFGPTQVMSAGTMVVVRDTTGAFISAWQPADHIGAQLVNEPGSFIWNELSSSDPAKSKEFYTEVFGWGWHGSDYFEAQVGDRTIAGLTPRRPGTPDQVPDHWLVYFATADIEADTARAGSLGATVLVPPTAIPSMGRFSVLSDPQGAVFALFQP